MSKDFLTDEEMNQLEATHASHPEFISDEDMSNIENSPTGIPDKLQATESGILSGSMLGKISAGLGAIPRAIALQESPVDAYHQLSQPLEQELQASEKFHPTDTTLGKLAGSIPATAVTTALAGPVAGMGVYSGLQNLSETGDPLKAFGSGLLGAAGGKIFQNAKAGTALLGAAGAGLGGLISGGSPTGTPEEQEKFLAGATTGGGIGALGGRALETVVPGAASIIGNTGVIKNIATAFDLAKQGQPIIGDIGKSAYAASEKENISGLMQPMHNVMTHIINIKNQAIQAATDAGNTIDVSNVLSGGLEELGKIAQEGMLTVTKPEQKAFFEALAPFTSEGRPLTPFEADKLNETLRNLEFKFNKQGSPLGSLVSSLRKSLKQETSENVPGYTEANKLFTDFMNAGPDHILSEGMKDLNFKSFSETNNPDQALYNKFDTLINKSPTSELSATRVKDELAQNLLNFDKQHPGLLEKGGFGSVSDYAQHLNDTIKEAKTYKAYSDASGFKSIAKALPALASVAGTATRAAKQIGANTDQVVAGVSGNQGQKLLDSNFKMLGNANAEDLQTIASKLSTNEATKYISDSLTQALKSGDNLSKNAVIFSILQSPAARKLLGKQ